MMISRINLAVGIVGGIFVAFAIFGFFNWLVWLPAARQEGRETERAEVLKQSMENIKRRSQTNAEIERMDARQLCTALGGGWVPENKQCL